jgi:tol-pal system protein YbgF
MSRALGALAVVAILAGGCASQSTVSRLDSEVTKLRSELAELRVAQEVTARDLARVTPQIQALDARASELQVSGRAVADEVARLTRRADSVDTTIGETRARMEALAPAAKPPAPVPPPAATASPGMDRPRVPPAPAPSAVPESPTAGTPPAAPAAPSAPAPAVPTPPPAPTAPAAPSQRATPTPPSMPTRPTTPAPSVTPTPPGAPARPAPRAGNPEQEYANALATFRAREHGQAVLDLLDFIAKYPQHSLAGNAQYWIGEAYWAQRDYRQALVEFEKVFEHGPGKAPDALVKIGLCHVRLHNLPRAQQAWQRAVREYPRSEAATTAQSLLRTHAAAR